MLLKVLAFYRRDRRTRGIVGDHRNYLRKGEQAITFLERQAVRLLSACGRRRSFESANSQRLDWQPLARVSPLRRVVRNPKHLKKIGRLKTASFED